MRMDSSCITLTCVLLLQMTLSLIMLNPVYDVRKLTDFLSHVTTHYKKTYVCLVVLYFLIIVYLGMYIPLQNIRSLLFQRNLPAHDKMILLGRMEKHYIIAGFSLFMVVILFGIRALLCYTSTLLQLTKKSSAMLLRDTVKGNTIADSWKMKRSISYECICLNDLADQLTTMPTKADGATGRCVCPVKHLRQTKFNLAADTVN